MHTVFWITIIGFTAAAVYFSLVHRHFYSDGSYIFLRMVESQEYFYPLKSRAIAIILNQFLTVVLMWAGVTDIEVLSWSFGINHHLVLIAGLVLSYLVIGPRKALFLFPLCSFYLIYVNHSLQIVSESHVTAALAWPCFLLLVVDDDPPLWKYLVAWLFIFGLLYSYEGNFILFLLMGMVVLGQLLSRGIHVPRILTLVFLLTGFVMTFYGTLSVEGDVMVGNRATVFYITSLLVHPVFWASVVLVGTLLALAGVIPIKQVIGHRLFVLAVLFIAGYTIIFNDFLFPQFQHRARGLNLIAPILLGAGFLYGRKCKSLRLPSSQLIAATLIVIFYQLQIGIQWHRFLEQMGECMKDNPGVIEIVDCNIDESLLDYSTNWTRPYLSILWQAVNHEDIATVINSTDYPYWQIWNSNDPTAWPDLSANDIEFKKERF